MRKDLIDICVEVKHETSAALLVFDGSIECWVPKSQIDPDESDKLSPGDEGTIVIPEWLAEDKGLI